MKLKIAKGEEGIFIVYKPKGPTSFDIVARIRAVTGIKKVGHAGTLDPLASGVLLVAVGRRFTRQIETLKGLEKEYEALLQMGYTSKTGDEEGDKTKVNSAKRPKLKEIEKVLSGFLGKIKQTPPVFSAVKVGGQRAYHLARAGKAVKLKPRLVYIKKIQILRYKYPLLAVKIVCGTGTYIRSLARDIGEKLGVGAYLADLVRTRVGNYKLSQAIALPTNFKKIQKKSR